MRSSRQRRESGVVRRRRFQPGDRCATVAVGNLLDDIVERRNDRWRRVLHGDDQVFGAPRQSEPGVVHVVVVLVRAEVHPRRVRKDGEILRDVTALKEVLVDRIGRWRQPVEIGERVLQTGANVQLVFVGLDAESSVKGETDLRSSGDVEKVEDGEPVTVALRVILRGEGDYVAVRSIARCQ